MLCMTVPVLTKRIIEVGSKTSRGGSGGSVVGKNRRNTLREITMFNENCECRGTRGDRGGWPWLSPTPRRDAPRRLVWHRLVPNRDAAKRYSDCALSGFAEFFPPRQKGDLCVTAGQKPRLHEQKRAMDMDRARARSSDFAALSVSQGKF